jgi:hypothetical protein
VKRVGRHRFDADGDDHVGPPEADEIRGVRHGFESGRAVAMNGDAGDARREPAEERDHAADVLSARGLADVARDEELIDVVGLER